MMLSIMSGSLIRDTPPWARMSAGTRSSAITATAPASSAILACSAVTTSMMTPPLSISAIPRFTRAVPVAGRVSGAVVGEFSTVTFGLLGGKSGAGDGSIVRRSRRTTPTEVTVGGELGVRVVDEVDCPWSGCPASQQEPPHPGSAPQGEGRPRDVVVDPTSDLDPPTKLDQLLVKGFGVLVIQR